MIELNVYASILYMKGTERYAGQVRCIVYVEKRPVGYIISTRDHLEGVGAIYA